MSFKEIFCQDRAVSVLRRGFDAGRSSHAYIFFGRDGVGKYKTACCWAKLALCHGAVRDDDGLSESCGSCESCRQFEAGAHPDFEHIYKELVEFTEKGKGKKTPLDLPIDVVREFLVARVSVKPSVSQRRVFVVSEAERLNTASQNSLLKALEEPPDYCTIILLCTRPDKLLATVKSRCQAVRFGPVSEDVILARLKSMGLSDESSLYFSRLSDGSLGLACRLADLELGGVKFYEGKKEILSSLSDFNYADSLRLAGFVGQLGKSFSAGWVKLEPETSRKDIKRRVNRTVLQIFISVLHDAIRVCIGEDKGLTNSDQAECVRVLAERFGLESAAEKTADCYRAIRRLESNVNERLIFEQLLLSLVKNGKMNSLR